MSKESKKTDVEINIGISKASIARMHREYKQAIAQLDKGSAKVAMDGLKIEQQKLNALKQQHAVLSRTWREGRLAQGIGGMARGAVGMGRMGVGMAASVAGGIGGFLLGGAVSAYQKHVQLQRTLGQSIGMFGPGERFARGGSGIKYGYSSLDLAAMRPVMGRSTGVGNVGALAAGTRAAGMSAEEVGKHFSSIRQGGLDFRPAKGGSKGEREFVKLMGLGLYSGLEKARLPEYFDSVDKLMKKAEMSYSGTLEGSSIGKELAAWGKTGKAGFQGRRGGQLMDRVLSAIQNPGGGEYGEAFMNQAMGFGKPGGGASYFEAINKRQQAYRDPSMIKDVIKEAVSQFGSGGEGQLSLSKTMGISMSDAKDLMDLVQSGQDSVTTEKEIKKVLDKNKSIQELALEEMKRSNTGTLKHLASIDTIGAAQGATVAEFFEWIQKKGIQIFTTIMDAVKTNLPMLKNIWEELKTTFEFLTGSSGKEGRKKYKEFMKSTMLSNLDENTNVSEYIRQHRAMAAVTIKAQEDKYQKASDQAKLVLKDQEEMSNPETSTFRSMILFLKQAGKAVFQNASGASVVKDQIEAEKALEKTKKVKEVLDKAAYDKVEDIEELRARLKKGGAESGEVGRTRTGNDPKGAYSGDNKDEIEKQKLLKMWREATPGPLGFSTPILKLQIDKGMNFSTVPGGSNTSSDGREVILYG